MALESARASVLIPSNAGIPVSADGVEIGTVDGRIDLEEVTANDKQMNVKVEVPRLRVSLPEGSTTHAQSLGPMAKVSYGAHRGRPTTFVVLPLDPIRKEEKDAEESAPEAAVAPGVGGPEGRAEMAPAAPAAGGGLGFNAHLAEVQVVRGKDVKVDLDGNVGEKPGTGELTGQIRLRNGGTLVVQGRTFTVESGTVTFVGADTSNPEVVVKAGWTASDGTVVYANFIGPLKTGKVTLTSEPRLSQQEIVELLLFGSTDGPQALTPSASTENSAIAAAGGQAAQPLNHALGQLGLGAVTAKVDTSESATPKPEVEVQIAKDISLEIAFVLGQPPPGVNPDSTLVTLDWRLLRKWSLATTVGNAGTTIFDVLWRKRY
jgi:translocation and assembly module TamB